MRGFVPADEALWVTETRVFQGQDGCRHFRGPPRRDPCHSSRSETAEEIQQGKICSGPLFGKRISTHAIPSAVYRAPPPAAVTAKSPQRPSPSRLRDKPSSDGGNDLRDKPKIEGQHGGREDGRAKRTGRGAAKGGRGERAGRGGGGQRSQHSSQREEPEGREGQQKMRVLIGARLQRQAAQVRGNRLTAQAVILRSSHSGARQAACSSSRVHSKKGFCQNFPRHFGVLEATQCQRQPLPRRGLPAGHALVATHALPCRALPPPRAPPALRGGELRAAPCITSLIIDPESWWLFA